MMKISKQFLTVLMLFFAASILANNTPVSKVSLTNENTTNKYVMLRFDLSRENFWRVPNIGHKRDSEISIASPSIGQFIPEEGVSAEGRQLVAWIEPGITRGVNPASESRSELTGDESLENNCNDETVPDRSEEYCAASNTVQDEYIVNVLCGTIDNSSGWQSGVADYTNQYTNIFAGQSQAIVTTSAASYDNYDKVTCWVDWNMNYEFEEGSEKYVLTSNTGGAKFNGAIYVPLETPVGDYRMRIRMGYYYEGGGDPVPCGEMGNGEVEDYTIRVIEPFAKDVGVSALRYSFNTPGVTTPKATVKNFGSLTETFNVTMTIGTYTSTKSVVDLASGAILEVTFDDWTAASGSYTATACTQLAGDEDPSNNCKSMSSSTEYCEAIHYLQGLYIEHVECGSINNRTGWQFGVADYTDKYTNIPAGQAANITVHTYCAGSWENVTCWVDWNMNHEFEEGDEKYVLVKSFSYDDYHCFCGVIAVPAGTPNGNYRMRIRSCGNQALNPCGILALGEVEDYTIRVGEPIAKDVGISLFQMKRSYTPGIVTPKAFVRNFGLGFQTFNVTMTIGTYTSTKSVEDLAPTDFQLVVFDVWDAAPGNYTATVCTQLAGDEFSVNDCKSMDILAGYCSVLSEISDGWVSNVLCGSINNQSTYSLQGVEDFTNLYTNIFTGLSESITVTIKLNFNPTGSEKVTCWVDWDLNYEFDDGEEKFVLTKSDDGLTFTGDIVVPYGTPVGNYRMRVGTARLNDPNPCAWSGDLEDYTIHVLPHMNEVGVSALNMGSFLAPGVVIPKATVKNFGTASQTFDVTMTIGTYTSTKEVTALASGATWEVTFDDWTATHGNYTAQACTQLAGDEYPNNDCKSMDIGVGVYCPASNNIEDGYIENVLCGSINNSSGWQNDVADYTAFYTRIAAGQSEDIVVTLRDASSYHKVNCWIDWDMSYNFDDGDEKYVLTSDDSGATFTGAIVVPVGVPEGNYRMRVRMSNYNGSGDPVSCGEMENGEVEDYNIHVGEEPYAKDVGVSALNMDYWYVPGVVTPKATVKNFGTASQTFDVTMTIGSYTSTKSVEDLASGAILEVTFDDWTAAHGNYTAQVCTQLTDDGYPDNDCKSMDITADYCPASTEGEYAYIENVVCGNINNSSGCQGGVADYTDIYTIIGPGESEYIGVTVYYRTLIWGDETVTCWVDWNMNCRFEEGNEKFCLHLPHGINKWDGLITVPIGTPAGNYRMRVRSITSPWPDPCGTTMYGEVEDYTIRVPANEVCVSTINMSDWYQPGVVTPKATVKNIGTASQTFDVTMTIGSYTSTKSVEGLASGTTREVTFADWTAAHGTYTAQACTQLAGDEYPNNDCKSMDILAWYCPASTINQDGYIKNVLFGNINNSSGWQGGVADYTTISTVIYPGQSEGIVVTTNTPNSDNVTCWVDWDMSYSFDDGNEKFVLVSDGGSAKFTGAIAVPVGTPEGNYRMRIRMSNADDPDPCGAMNYGEVEDYTIRLNSKDVGVTDINMGGFYYGIATPKATVKNFSITSQTFDVTMTIDTYTSTRNVADLESGATREVTFDNWNATSGSYIAEACTQLANDVNHSNDCKSIGYCTAISYQKVDYIVNVLCGTINNSSGWQSGVADYTAILTSIGARPSEVITVTVTDSYGNEYTNQVSCWVDWNMNYAFEEGNERYVLTSDNGGATFIGAIYVPLGTPEGDYRMRIRNLCHTLRDVVPCGRLDSGDIEDYTIRVHYCQFTPGGIETTGETICYNGDPIEIGSAILASGCDESITYAWYKSTNDFTDSTLIAGAILASYNPPSGLTETTSYRRYAKDAIYNLDFEVSAGTWKVTVYNDFTPGGIETTGEIICYGDTPSEIGSSTTASGGDETITYSWRSSADNYTEAIVGATSSTYTPPAALTTTTSYRRYAEDATCIPTPTVSTGTWTVTVRDQFTAGAILTTGETFCFKGDPSIIGSATNASGGDNSITYKWQANGVDIETSDAATYTPPANLAATTTYTRFAKDNTCSNSFTQSSGNWLVEVELDFVPPTKTLADLVVTKASTDATLKYYSAPSGGTEFFSNEPIAYTPTTYFISQVVNDVESTDRLAVTAYVDQTPCAPSGDEAQSVSLGTVGNLVVSGTNIRWYDTLAGGTLIETGTSLVVGTIYYASQTVGCTESETRLAVTATAANP